VIKLTDAITGDPILVNPAHIVLVAEDEDDDNHRCITVSPADVGNIFVTETTDEIIALLRPQA
jgi:hypothetical protein